MRKANIRNTKTKCEIRSNTAGSRKSIADLEQIFVSWKLLQAMRIALFHILSGYLKFTVFRTLLCPFSLFSIRLT